MLKVETDLLYKDLIPKGFDYAKQFCSGGYPDPNGCAWYHGVWMLLRYLDITSNPYWHTDFFENAIKETDATSKNVLVIGTADFSMPLFCYESGIASLGVCDKCLTPIKICNIVSNLLELDWNCFVHDIRQPLPQKTDVIVNDAFLSRFEDKSIPLIGIAQALNVGGYYITTIKKGSKNAGGEIDDKLKKSFVHKVTKRFQDKFGSNIYLPDIEKMAQTYINRMASCPVQNEQELLSIFQHSGLTIQSLNEQEVVGEYEPVKYFNVIAVKHE